MKKYFLGLIALLFVTGVFAKGGYVGLGADSITVSGKSSGKSDESYGTGIKLNGGYIVNDNSRINMFYTSAKISELGKDFFKTSTLGLSYDYMFGKEVHQGFFVGGGLANTTVEIAGSSVVTVVNITMRGKGSSTGLLVRAGYEHLFDNGLFLLATYNYDAGKQNFDTDIIGSIGAVTVSETTNAKTSLGSFGVSINYAF